MTPYERAAVEQMRNALVVAKNIIKGLADHVRLNDQKAIEQTLEDAIAAGKCMRQPAGPDDRCVSLEDLSLSEKLTIQAGLTELLVRMSAYPEPDVSGETCVLVDRLRREQQFEASRLQTLLGKVSAAVDKPASAAEVR